MSEMVERVARAMDPAIWDGTPFTPMDHSIFGGARAMSLSKARAAIAAMREPTEAMIKAGFHAGTDNDEEVVWNAMIDEALRD